MKNLVRKKSRVYNRRSVIKVSTEKCAAVSVNHVLSIYSGVLCTKVTGHIFGPIEEYSVVIV
jgi:hypothetical protein